jgi:two-component system, NtrC family, sensor histidine kinase HydH
LKTFDVLRRFVVVGALAIGLFSAALASVLSEFMEERMLQRDATVSRDFVQSIANSQHIAAAFQTGDIGSSPEFADFFAHVAAMPDVLRANIYTPQHRMLWSSRPELIGQTFPDNPELARALQREIVVEISTHHGGPTKSEHVLMDTDTTRYIEHYAPVLDRDGRTVLGVIELYRQPFDLFRAIRSGQRLVWTSALLGGAGLFLVLVGFVRHTERALRRQQHQLVEAEALALVGEISATVAHSIRNPLGAIRSTAELQAHLNGDPQGVQAQIMQDTDRIESLVRTLLSYASPSPTDPTPGTSGTRTDLDALLARLATRWTPELERHDKHLRFDLSPGLGHLAIDPVLFTQVLQSLLTNACEATGAHGRIRLRARRRGHTATLCLVDDGEGLPPGQHQAVFRPFYTTKSRGLGMGLALARRVIERAGGDIHLSSQRGRGTTVRLRLPVTDH